MDNDLTDSEWLHLIPASKRSKPDTAEAPIVNYAIEDDQTIQVRNSEAHSIFAATRHSDSPSERSECDDNHEEPVAKETSAATQKLKPSEFYDMYVKRTEEECIAEATAPQKSDLWLKARELCITGSQFGSASGHSPYQTPDELLVEKLWNRFEGNVATRWGNAHEPHAREAFCEWFTQYGARMGYTHIVFQEPNLLKYAQAPWMAVSPDGLVSYTHEGKRITDLIEYKCPYYLRDTYKHPYGSSPLNTPPQYEAQIQGIMGYLTEYAVQINTCWFVIWQPRQTFITKRTFRPALYKTLVETLSKWYFTKYLPALTHKHNGELAEGNSKPQAIIHCE